VFPNCTIFSSQHTRAQRLVGCGALLFGSRQPATAARLFCWSLCFTFRKPFYKILNCALRSYLTLSSRPLERWAGSADDKTKQSEKI